MANTGCRYDRHHLYEHGAKGYAPDTLTFLLTNKFQEATGYFSFVYYVC